MENKSRSTYTIFNFVFNILSQIITIILKFVSRTIFIYFLGEGYLGISSLFTNILSVLSLAELGINSAMVYSMYEPLAKRDNKKLRALTNYYKVLYQKIAFAIFFIGIILIPFLPFIINLTVKIDNIYIYYILYLINTCISYLFVYKTSILITDQKEYKTKYIKIVMDVLLVIFQCVALFMFKNFLLYLIIQIFFTFLTNYLTAKLTEKHYPFLNENTESLSNTEKQDIWSNIKAMFSYKVGGVIMNNTDQLYISALISTEMVGIYSNYLMIVNSISVLTSAFFVAVKSSIGNLAVENNREKEYELFKCLDIVAFYVYGFVGICFIFLFNRFIFLWIGEMYILEIPVVIVISISFYISGILYPIWCFRETVGLFKETKNILLYSSIINLVLSYFFGNLFGLTGILFATIIARLLTNLWFEPYKLFKIYFKKSVFDYYKNNILNLLFIFLNCLILKCFISLIAFDSSFISLIYIFLMIFIFFNVSVFIYLKLIGDYKLISKYINNIVKKRSK